MWARLSALVFFLVTVQPLALSQEAVPTLRLLGSVNAEGLWAALGVSAYKNLAFTGWPHALGVVAIVDISDPSAPVFLGHTPIDPTDRYGFEEHRAMRIDRRDVLVVYLGSASDGANHTVLKLFDIGDPADPQLIGTYQAPKGGFHFEVAQQGRRTLALLGSYGAEALTSNYGKQPGLGDLLIVDISDPANPVLAGEWGVIDEPLLGLDVFLGGNRGTHSKDFLECVWVSPNGRRAYLAYSDLGVMILDISDPAHPRFLGRVGYEAGDQGDAFEVRTVKDGSVLVRSSLSRSPFRTDLRSNAFGGVRSGGEDLSAPAIYELNGSHSLSGEVAPVGRACPGDPYLTDPAGRIALIEEDGPCALSLRVGLAQRAGATGAVFYKPVYAGGFIDSHGSHGLGGRFRDPDTGEWVAITIPVVSVGWNTGNCLAQVKDSEGNLVAQDCVETLHAWLEATAVFTGYGRLEIFDIADPSAPIKLSTVGSPHAMDLAYALANRTQPGMPTRDTSVNHLEVSGNTIYASAWADGLRVIDVSRPSAPREIASWNGQGADPGDFPLCAWDVVRHHGLILLNGYKHGIYILEDAR